MLIPFAKPAQRTHPQWFLLCSVLVIGVGVHAWQSFAAAPAKRARAPKFPQSIEDVFFPNANEKLVGPRPTAADPAAKSTSSLPSATPGGSMPAAPAGSLAWSKLITAADVEDEIKTGQIKLAETAQNAARFKGGEYQDARTRLSVLAAMLAIVAEYDDRIRWQDEAAALRDLMGRASFNCKVASDASFNEARSRADDLQILVRGGSLSLAKPADKVAWPRVVDRQSLMKRLESAQQQGIQPAIANARQFEQYADRVLHEAQVIAALAELITREGYEFADDDTYLEHARDMQQRALSLRDATLQGNYEQARQVAGQLGQSCTNCHEGYRS